MRSSCPLSKQLSKSKKRLSTTSSLDSKVSSGVCTAAVAKMAASSTTVTTTTADGVRCTAELLDLISGQVGKSLTLEWIAKHDSTRDVGSRDTVAESVVNDHGALTVARNDDLGARALLERLLNVLSHHLSTIGTQVGISLIVC